MAVTTLKVLASILQLHGPGATIQSDHQGIDALLSDLRGQSADHPVATEVAFRRGAFCPEGLRAGAFRRAADMLPVSARSAEADFFEDTRPVDHW